jgi:hypothetical protein
MRRRLLLLATVLAVAAVAVPMARAQTAQPLLIGLVCTAADQQPTLEVVVTNTGENLAEYRTEIQVDGQPAGTTFHTLQPGAQFTISQQLTQGTQPGDLVVVRATRTDSVTGAQTVFEERAIVPDCTGSTTTTTQPTSTTDTTTVPTTSTTVPPPDCDCEGREVTVANADKYLRPAKSLTDAGITCFSIRLVAGKYVVSASGPEAALTKLFD